MNVLRRNAVFVLAWILFRLLMILVAVQERLRNEGGQALWKPLLRGGARVPYRRQNRAGVLARLQAAAPAAQPSSAASRRVPTGTPQPVHASQPARAV